MLSENRHLKEFYLHFNLIKAGGAIKIFQGLLKNKDLKVLDMSMNKFGGSDQLVTQLFCKILRTNKSLVHVDFSFNYFTKEESE
jgi:hypothetical protein